MNGKKHVSFCGRCAGEDDKAMSRKTVKSFNNVLVMEEKTCVQYIINELL